MNTCQQCGKAVRIRTSERKGDTYVRYHDPCRCCGNKQPPAFANASEVKQRITCKRGNRT